MREDVVAFFPEEVDVAGEAVIEESELKADVILVGTLPGYPRS